jgi:hypothetical protein
MQYLLHQCESCRDTLQMCSNKCWEYVRLSVVSRGVYSKKTVTALLRHFFTIVSASISCECVSHFHSGWNAYEWNSKFQMELSWRKLWQWCRRAAFHAITFPNPIDRIDYHHLGHGLVVVVGYVFSAVAEGSVLTSPAWLCTLVTTNVPAVLLVIIHF